MTISPAEACKTSLLELIQDMHDNIFAPYSPEKGDMLLLQYFFERMSAADLLSHVIKHFLPNSANIANRDLGFLHKSGGALPALPKDRVYNLVLMIEGKKPGISSENRDVIFSYFDCIIKSASKFKNS